MQPTVEEFLVLYPEFASLAVELLESFLVDAWSEVNGGLWVGHGYDYRRRACMLITAHRAMLRWQQLHSAASSALAVSQGSGAGIPYTGVPGLTTEQETAYGRELMSLRRRISPRSMVL